MGHPERPRVVVAGLGDTGLLIATRLARTCDVVGISTRPALVSGQELGMRLSEPWRWRRTYFVPFDRLRGLDRVRTVHGRVTAVDLDGRTVHLERADGTVGTEPYDVLVVATGASNGFWRHDRVEGIEEIEAGLATPAARLAAASTVAVVGGGATGVSVADHLARRGVVEVHLFHPGELPLPGYHPKVRQWAAGVLRTDGVHVHPDHRAEVPDGFAGDRLTTGPVTWSTGQDPFAADCTLWGLGRVRPHSGFLPATVLDDDGFVRVDQYLRVPGHPEVLAVGDVAATDPNRSSARNWGWRVATVNARVAANGGNGRLRRFRAPHHRWGSVFGLQENGLVVVQPGGGRFRFPRAAAEALLYRLFVTGYLYRGIRSAAPGGRP